MIGGSLALYARRAPTLKSNTGFELSSRESFLLFNNILLVVATATDVSAGTMAPLISDALGLRRLVGGRAVFQPDVHAADAAADRAGGGRAACELEEKGAGRAPRGAVVDPAMGPPRRRRDRRCQRWRARGPWLARTGGGGMSRWSIPSVACVRLSLTPGDHGHGDLACGARAVRDLDHPWSRPTTSGTRRRTRGRRVVRSGGNSYRLRTPNRSRGPELRRRAGRDRGVRGRSPVTASPERRYWVQVGHEPRPASRCALATSSPRARRVIPVAFAGAGDAGRCGRWWQLRPSSRRC